MMATHEFVVPRSMPMILAMFVSQTSLADGPLGLRWKRPWPDHPRFFLEAAQ